MARVSAYDINSVGLMMKHTMIYSKIQYNVYATTNDMLNVHYKCFLIIKSEI